MEKIAHTINILITNEKRLEKRRAPKSLGRDAGKRTAKQKTVIQNLYPVVLSSIQSGRPFALNLSKVLGIVVLSST